MRKLSSREQHRRGCAYCADAEISGTSRLTIRCTLKECPYTELEDVNFKRLERVKEVKPLPDEVDVMKRADNEYSDFDAADYC